MAKDVHVWLHHYDLIAGASLTHFMKEKVTESDKVILILTPAYNQKADNRKGGVGYEHAMISPELYQSQLSRKFIPVVRKGNWDTASPKFIKSILAIDMTHEVDSALKFKQLLHAIPNQPVTPKPSIGKSPVFGSGTDNSHGHNDGSCNDPDGARAVPAANVPQLIEKIPCAGVPAPGNSLGEIINPGMQWKSSDSIDLRNGPLRLAYSP